MSIGKVANDVLRFIAASCNGAAAILAIPHPEVALGFKVAGSAVGLAADLVDSGVDPESIARVPASKELLQSMTDHWGTS